MNESWRVSDSLSTPTAFNPYGATVETEVVEPTREGKIRREHLHHEASVRSLGTLFILGGVLLCIVSMGSHVWLVSSAGFIGSVEIGSLVACGVLALMQFTTGFGLRAFRPWARIFGMLLSTVGLFAFPIGTIFCAYFLYLLGGGKGRYVFTDEYQQIRSATPHIRSIVPAWFWIALLLWMIASGLTVWWVIA
jgi:hypothetical protein